MLGDGGRDGVPGVLFELIGEPLALVGGQRLEFGVEIHEGLARLLAEEFLHGDNERLFALLGHGTLLFQGLNARHQDFKEGEPVRVLV